MKYGMTDKEENIEDGKVLTLDDAAKFLQTSYSTVYRLVIDGELEAFRLRYGWRTSEAACRMFMRKRFAERKATCKAIEIE